MAETSVKPKTPNEMASFQKLLSTKSSHESDDDFLISLGQLCYGAVSSFQGTISIRNMFHTSAAKMVKEQHAAKAEPETDEAKPETADAEPETAETEPETDEAKPETADAEPETADAEPETAEAEPETVEAEPEVAPERSEWPTMPVPEDEAAFATFYRQVSLMCHPDRCDDVQANDAFRFAKSARDRNDSCSLMAIAQAANSVAKVKTLLKSTSLANHVATCLQILNRANLTGFPALTT